MRSVLCEDLAGHLRDPDALREFVIESLRISTVDRLVNELVGAMQEQGLSRAEIARRLSTQSATVRRLLTQSGHNPTLGMVAEVAGVLGYRLELVPMSAEERERIAEPLRLAPGAPARSGA